MKTRVWAVGYSGFFLTAVHGSAWGREGERNRKAASVSIGVRFLVLEATGSFLFDGIPQTVGITGEVAVGCVGSVYGGLGGRATLVVG